VRCCKIVLVRLLSSALLLPAVCVLLPSNVKLQMSTLVEQPGEGWSYAVVHVQAFCSVHWRLWQLHS
jgi:hypothetical protein